MSTRTRRMATTVAGTVLAGAGLLAATSPAAEAIGAPVVAPSTLVDGKPVQASLSDLTVGKEYFIAICDADGSNPLVPPSCNEVTGQWVRLTATATTATVSFTAAKSFDAPSHGPIPGKHVDCKGATGTQCYLVVTQHELPYPSKGTPVTFK